MAVSIEKGDQGGESDASASAFNSRHSTLKVRAHGRPPSIVSGKRSSVLRASGSTIWF